MKIVMILFLSFLVVSCGKKNQIKVTAKNAATGEGYADLGFRIREIKPYTTPTGEVQEVVYEGSLNQDGEAIVDIRLKNRSYVITTITPENDNRCYINNTSYNFHRDDDNLKFDFLFAPCAYLKLKIENVNCEGPDDNFKLFFEGKQVPGNEFLNGSLMSEHNGCVNLTSNDYISHPMGERYYRWEVTRSGITEEFHDTIYLEESEQKVYEINY